VLSSPVKKPIVLIPSGVAAQTVKFTIIFEDGEGAASFGFPALAEISHLKSFLVRECQGRVGGLPGVEVEFRDLFIYTEKGVLSNNTQLLSIKADALLVKTTFKVTAFPHTTTTNLPFLSLAPLLQFSERLDWVIWQPLSRRGFSCPRDVATLIAGLLSLAVRLFVLWFPVWYFERKNLAQIAYLCGMAKTTIGFGDVVPATWQIRTLLICVIGWPPLRRFLFSFRRLGCF
jgi:hypothetical protein